MTTEPHIVALFPIPNLVAFPGTTVPLHVFEPRYRRLIHESVEAARMVGVCHTRKQISPARQHDTVEEALNSNQATFEPQRVFSAGDVEVIQTTPDGRLLAHVRMRRRLTLEREVQALPYRIVECRELVDRNGCHPADRVLQEDICRRLLGLIRAGDPELAQRLEDGDWLELSPAAFSFQVFQVLRLDPERMQAVLESTSATERLALIWSVLESA